MRVCMTYYETRQDSLYLVLDISLQRVKEICVYTAPKFLQDIVEPFDCLAFRHVKLYINSIQ